MKKLSIITIATLGLCLAATSGWAQNSNKLNIDWLSPESKDMLINSCFDCHSDLNNETKPGVSSKDIRKGKKKVNYSKWSGYDVRTQAKKMKKSIETIRDKEMPTEDYLAANPHLAVTAQQLQQLIDDYNNWTP